MRKQKMQIKYYKRLLTSFSSMAFLATCWFAVARLWRLFAIRKAKYLANRLNIVITFGLCTSVVWLRSLVVYFISFKLKEFPIIDVDVSSNVSGSIPDSRPSSLDDSLTKLVDDFLDSLTFLGNKIEKLETVFRIVSYRIQMSMF